MLEWKITIITDDAAQKFMSNEDLEKAIDKNVKRWTPGLDIMPMISDWEIERI